MSEHQPTSGRPTHGHPSLGRIIIDNVRPRTLTAAFPAKAAIGETVPVSADIFRDGHDILGARVRWRPGGDGSGDGKWQDAPLQHAGNDRWETTIEPTHLGAHELVVEAWTDRVATWRHDVEVKYAAGQILDVELHEGADLFSARAADVAEGERAALEEVAVTLRDGSRTIEERLVAAAAPDVVAALDGVPDPIDLTASRPYRLWVDRERALFGAWYELFPRSEGGLRAAAAARLPAIAEMGFDVVYLPPVHPIGRTFRKGRNNTLLAGPDDPGSPWAIGATEGGHTALDPGLGTFEDFDFFVAEANRLGMEVALDYALQCSPDHPWVGEHPEWFHQRPDGTIRYAENPPKKYQDIYPVNFWPEPPGAREALWQACRDIIDLWISHGVRIFRVDNPHTKPFAFWSWLIGGVQAEHPDVIFLSEAFTRPKVMAKLAEVGFSQSYTYFTWRTTRAELRTYVEELTQGPTADYMRPNFWPNTPDILSGPLRNGPPAAFRLRFLLAATLVPSYGLYSGYELYENEPMADTNEEYRYSEKYEVKARDWARPDSMAPFIAHVNAIRRRHPAFAEPRAVRFHHTNNDQLLVYSRVSADGSDVVLVVANLDPYHPQADTPWLDLDHLGFGPAESFVAYDELTGDVFTWQGPMPYVSIDPLRQPGHVLHLRKL